MSEIPVKIDDDLQSLLDTHGGPQLVDRGEAPRTIAQAINGLRDGGLILLDRGSEALGNMRPNRATQMIPAHSLTAFYATGKSIIYAPSPYGVTWAFCLIDNDDNLVYGAGGIILTLNELSRISYEYPERIALPAMGARVISTRIANYISIAMAIESLPPSFRGAAISIDRTNLGRIFFGWPGNGVPEYWQDRAISAADAAGGKLYLHPFLGSGKEGGAETRLETREKISASPHYNWCKQYCAALTAWYIAQYCPPEQPPPGSDDADGDRLRYTIGETLKESLKETLTKTLRETRS